LSFFNSQLYFSVGLPVIIFFARICDVSLQTLRIIYISRGKRNIAPLIGFVETFIWITVVAQVMRSVNALPTYLGYAAGFAAGSFVGMFVEDRLAIGQQIIRIIIPDKVNELISNLRGAGYGVTRVAGEGSSGPVTLVYTVVNRKDLPGVLGLIHQSHPHAFLSIEDLRTIKEGVFPVHTQVSDSSLLGRKSK
jgi:uncharacterized protein YebE (UPF0316 family)